ncbi:MAG: hypothetical protein EPO13_01945 [Actinomycetota bacterium]|nr:MAG: hypothetical protein EPO13_01945 [Actinomycetota bacterium]
MSTSTKTRGPRRKRALVATTAVLALVATAGVVGATSASAADVDSGTVNWGFRAAFRTYVGNQTAALPPIGALPAGQRITVTAPATFDSAGTPSVAGNNETLPYVFAANSGSVGSATAATINGSGAVAYHFPSHAFDITIANPTVVVNGTTGQVLADVTVVIPENNVGQPPGTTSLSQVALGSIATASVSLGTNSATVSGTGVTLTAAGASALQNFLAEGAALDDISASVALEPVVVPPATPNGSVTLSKNTFDPAGDTVTVTGTGFFPTVNGTRPPLNGVPGGVYVVFGKFADVWQPTAGAPGSARSASPASAGGTKWAVPAASMATIGGAAAGAIELNPDGSFTATLNVKEAYTASVPATGNYGIYTYGGSGANSTGYETFTPITFATTPPPGPGEHEQTITATVPVQEPAGEFVWTIDATDHAVTLSEASNQGAYLQSTGDLKPVKVTDTRAGSPAWSVSGQVGDFTGGLSGKYLGWTPSVTAPGAGATAGAAVTPGIDSGNGLKDSSVLGSAVVGHEKGTGTLGAALDLRVPVTTAAGTYTATLTLTALS